MRESLLRVVSGMGVALVCLSAAVARGGIVISELVADNENGIRDEDGDRQDWLELYNAGDAAQDLDGWWLTDKAAAPTQWRLPAVTLPAQGYLLVWASGKNRADPAAPLHANFSLSKNGEYVGLYCPDPTNGLPVLVDAYAPAFPALPADVSYGRLFAASTTVFVAAGEIGRYRVLTAAQGDACYFGTNYASGHWGHGAPDGWNASPAFDDASWTAAATGVGYDTTGGFDPWIGASPSGNCLAALRNVNTSLGFRRTFVVPDPGALDELTLRLKYEDGFVAFVNGTEIARDNCTNAYAYNMKAVTALDEAKLNAWSEYAVPRNLLVPGTNLLAVQGLNVTLGSSDFLLLPELAGRLAALAAPTVYFAQPTPGTANGAGTAGPLLYGASPEDPEVPRPLGSPASPPLTVSVRVIRTARDVAAVRAYHRTQWEAESAPVEMRDDGVAPDDVAGDGVYCASLPTSGPAAGQMFRWRFEAQDVSNTVTRLPAFLDPLDDAQYFGTAAADPSAADSRLPVLEWFVQGAPANGPTAAAFRGCCYYRSNFYDNVGHQIHGQSTAGFAKKSYDFDFTAERRFLWQEGERRVKDINLLSNFADKTKTRNTLSHWAGAQAGTPHHFAFPVRVHLNGVFHGVMDLVEDGDDRMLERNGLDPEGALYKVYNADLVTQVEKKTRKEEGLDDLLALTNGLALAKASSLRQTYACDHLDLAATVNYIAARFITSDHDHGHKNLYLYRDTGASGEWQPLVWDVDLSWGHVFNATGTNNPYGKTLGYFDDALKATVGFSGGGNPVYRIIYDLPENRLMLMRRIRTLMDAWLQPPETVDGLFETRMRAIAADVDPDPADPSPWTDGDLDLARWGMSVYFATNRPREEVERVIAEYLGPRRDYLFNTGAGRFSYNGTVIPAPQTNAPGQVVFAGLDYLPASGSQDEEYVILRNASPEAVDLSGWRLSGQVSHVFRPGTVIPPGGGTAGENYVGLLHVVKNAAAFRARASGPTGGERRLAQGDYAGQLSARGGVLNLYDGAGLLIATTNYAGSPTAAQVRLRVTELQYHPAAPTPAEQAALVGVTEDDFEFVELMNVGFPALNLAGARFTEGIGYAFPATNLLAGKRLVLAKHPAAFALRYPEVGATVLGPYAGVLDNAGERLQIQDAWGETVLDFEYKDGWYPASDGGGRSLVLRDKATAYDAFGEPQAWALSGAAAGSPGLADDAWAQAYYGWDNFHFTSAERDDPLVGGPFADPDGDGRLNWVEYALGTDPRLADAWRLEFDVVPVAGQRYAAVRFPRAAHALDVSYELVAADDAAAGAPWPACAWVSHAVAPLAGEREEVTWRDAAATSEQAKRFYRLRINYEEEEP